MTKRFQIIGENYTNIDIPVFVICRENDCCFEVYESKEDAERVCDKLNHLIDENEQLKSICQDHRDHAIDFKADCVRLEKENEQLKQINRNLQDFRNFITERNVLNEKQ